MNIKDFKHKIKIKVRFSDLDAMQHVNNSAYLTYLEEARIDYFNNLFNRKKDSLDFTAVIARIEIDYINPIYWGDDIEVYTCVSDVGNKSITMSHIIAKRKGSELITIAESITRLVYYNYRTHSSMIIPEDVKNQIRNFEGMVNQKN